MRNDPIIYPNGTKVWYQEDKLHRLDGPAIEHFYGRKEWWINGLRHREDGPAIEYVNCNISNKCWYYYGEILRVSSQEEFIRLVNLKLFW